MSAQEFSLNARNADLIATLNNLIVNWETEVVEFKEANKDYDKDKIGQYFSAISNESNLKGLQYGWLIFGVRNKDRKIIGSEYRNKKGLDILKLEISQGTTGGISFVEIFEVYPIVDGEEKRVVMFQIPAAATAIPTGWHDHFYGRNGESLGALSVEELDRIRGQEKKDWSKQIIAYATLDCLDKNAVALARQVGVTVYGKVLDENYSRVLFENPDFDLSTVYLIDRVQKHAPISKEAIKELRRLGVIEGKAPNIYVSAKVAESTDTKAQYVKNKGFDDEYYKKLIVSYLETYQKGKKQDFIELLADKLPDTMDEKQKNSKVRNLLGSLKNERRIITDSDNKRLANWILQR